jgi:hypothetical protein
MQPTGKNVTVTPTFALTFGDFVRYNDHTREKQRNEQSARAKALAGEKGQKMKDTTKRKIGARALSGVLTAAAVLALAFVGCGNDTSEVAEQPAVKSPKTMDLAFGTDCKVTVKSDEKFLDAEWDALCNDVAIAINAGQAEAGPFVKPGFETVFVSNQNARVILGSDFEHDWEVKDGEFRTVYIKIGSIGTVDFVDIVMSMDLEVPYFGKAKVQKDGLGNNPVLANANKAWAENQCHQLAIANAATMRALSNARV